MIALVGANGACLVAAVVLLIVLGARQAPRTCPERCAVTLRTLTGDRLRETGSIGGAEPEKMEAQWERHIS